MILLGSPHQHRERLAKTVSCPPPKMTRPRADVADVSPADNVRSSTDPGGLPAPL